MRTLVITGGTRGIGKAAVAELLRRDPALRLVLLTRGRIDPDAGERVTPVTADLEDLGSVRAAVESIRQLLADGVLPPLAGFVGNAGIALVDATQATTDGLERTFAVNVAANHLLIHELAPLIQPPGRIVVTVSDTHFGDFRHTLGAVPAPRWSEPEVLARPGAFPHSEKKAGGLNAYSTSKLAAIYLVHEWARHLPPGIDIVGYNPSAVPGTGLTRHGNALTRFLMSTAIRPLTCTPLADRIDVAGSKLADVILGRTVAPSGAYVDRTRVVRSSGESYDVERERALWGFLNDVLGVSARRPAGGERPPAT